MEHAARRRGVAPMHPEEAGRGARGRAPVCRDLLAAARALARAALARTARRAAGAGAATARPRPLGLGGAACVREEPQRRCRQLHLAGLALKPGGPGAVAKKRPLRVAAPPRRRRPRDRLLAPRRRAARVRVAGQPAVALRLRDCCVFGRRRPERRLAVAVIGTQRRVLGRT